jgi:hypothetical protein
MSSGAPHRYGRALALTSGLTALVLLIGLAISRVADEALPYLTREPASVLDAAGYVGLLSNTTALVGVAASTSALLTWLVLGGTARSPWLWGGVLTGCLLVNDVFLVDDHYLTKIGIPEPVTSAVLGLGALAFTLAYRDFVRRHGTWLVAAALAGFFGAELLDRVSQDLDDVEDVLRFFSQLSWAAFFVRAAIGVLSAERRAGEGRSGPVGGRRALIVVYGAAVGAVLVVFALSRATDRPLEYFTREPADALDAPAYVGMLSNLGALVWGIAATCALLAWAVERSARALLFGGLLTILLLGDDFYRLHEDYYPRLGIRQRFSNVAYFLLVVSYLVVFRDYLRPRGGWLLVGAFGLLGVSAGLDILYRDQDGLEDAVKLLGIACWATFFALAGYDELRLRRASARTPG